MDNFAYMILIGALLVFAAWMLYARFAARSRKNSLHHGLGVVSSEDYTEEVVEDEGESAVIESEETSVIESSETLVQDEAEAQGAELIALEEAPEKKKEDEYFDELQKAAAGLAVLMRSSPVTNRKTSVVFAPDDDRNEVIFTEAEEAELTAAVMVWEPLMP